MQTQFHENDCKTLKKDKDIIYLRRMKKYLKDSLDTCIENEIKSPTILVDKNFLKKNNNIVLADFSNIGVLQDNML